MLRHLKYILLFTLISSNCFAATYYADTSAQGSGDCSSAGNACTVETCVESTAGYGDVCSLADGTYYTGQIVFPEGVSMISTSNDASLVVLRPSSTSTSQPFIKLSSASPGTTGNQSISYVTIDGRGPTYYYTHGIFVLNRDDVSIHHCIITDFYGNQTWANATGTAGSYAVTVLSNEVGITYQWNEFVADGNVNKTGWPTNPVDNFQFYSNTVTNCGDGTTDRVMCPAIYIWSLTNSSFHDNDVDVSHADTQVFYSTSALIDNVDIYNNTFTGKVNGQLPGATVDRALYLIELWNVYNCDIHNNVLTNGHISITIGQNTHIYENLIDLRSATEPVGRMIELTGMYNGSIHHNELFGHPGSYSTSGTHNAIHIGIETQQSQYNYNITTIVYGNVIHGGRHHGIETTCRPTAGPTPTCNLYIINNILDDVVNAGGGFAAIQLYQANGGTLNAYVRNNIISNNIYGITLTGSANTTIDNNIFVGNGTNLVNVSATNTDTVEPTYTDYANDDFTYASSGSAGVGDGDTLGVPYNIALSPSTNWSSDPLVVSTVDRGSYTPWDMGPYEYVAGGDQSPPEISSPDPYEGEILSSGTTSYNMEITCIDPSECTGCKADTDGGESYATMANAMVKQSGTTTSVWRHALSGLTDDTSYTWYFRCTDGTNTNTSDFTLNFSIEPDSTGVTIIDNLDAEYSEVGTWYNAVRADAYSGSHRYSNVASSTATFEFTPQVTGNYIVSAWRFDGGHDPAAVLTVNHAGGISYPVVNLVGADSGEWVEVGTYLFNASTPYDLTWTVGSLYITPDALKFSYSNPGSGSSVGGRSGIAVGGGHGFIVGRSAADPDFVMEVVIGPGDLTFTIPCQNVGTFNATIDWGDDSSSEITAYNDADLAHTYSGAGTYTVRISGTFPNIYFNNSGDIDEISKIINLGSVGWQTFRQAFYGCSNLTTVNGTGADVSNVTSFYVAFQGCSSLTSLSGLSSWDVSSVTTFENAFHSCSSLTSLGDLSSWDVSSVTTFSRTFYGCSSLTSLGDLSSWNVANVTSFYLTFYNCSSLTSLGDLSSWNVANVTSFYITFYNCSSLTSLGDLSAWDVSSVTSFYLTFQNCSSLTSLGDLSSWDVSNVTSFENAWDNANSALTTASYSAMLLAWSNLSLQSGVSAHFGNTQYYSDAEYATARGVLTGTYSWTITDGGVNGAAP